MAHRVDDLLLPLVKGVGSERAYEILTESLQTLRRFGLPAGLPHRAVHPRRQDRLAVRGHHRDPGAGLLLPQDRSRPWRGAGARCCADQPDHRHLRRGAENRRPSQLRTALEHVQAMTATLTGYLMAAAEQPTEIYKVGLASVRFLLAVGDLLIGWRLLVQANVAQAALAELEGRRGVLPGQDRHRDVLRRQHAA